MTLLELIIACSILVILASMAMPVARYSMVRGKEKELRGSLLDMREAIDRYHEAVSQQKIRGPVSSGGYPPSLETLAKEIQIGNSETKIRFLRKIPKDPMTGETDWGLRCVSDAPDSDIWCGTNVFDVYSKSRATATDGSKYSDW